MGCPGSRCLLHFTVNAEPNASSTTACIALGANLGDRRRAIESAAAAVAGLAGVHNARLSEIIETAPIGPPGQGMYLNAAMAFQTDLTPRGLLDAVLEIEHAHGRERRERWGARTLDLDILLFGLLVIDEPGLTVPHPRMRERLFVLGPLAEVAPDAVDPVTGETVRSLLDRLRLTAQRKAAT